MLHGEHPNGCRGGCHEQREGNMGAQMEHELAHHCVLGKTIRLFLLLCISSLFGSRLKVLIYILLQAILNTAAKFVMISWVVTQRGPTYPAMFCAVTVFFTTILDSLLLGNELSVGRYAYHFSPSYVNKC